jgi:hypothetical protein
VPNFRRLDLMNDRVKTCRRKASDCLRAATLATGKDTRLMYLDLAQQWRQLAEQVKELERRYDDPSPLAPYAVTTPHFGPTERD